MTPYRNDICAISTTFYHLVFSLSSPPSVIPSSVVARSRPYGPDVSHTVSFSTSAAASAALCSCGHSQRCSARIWEGPPDRFPRSLHTAHSTSSSVGTESSIENGGTDVGIVSPVGGEGAVEFLALHRYPLECYSSGQRGLVYHFSVPPPHPPP